MGQGRQQRPLELRVAGQTQPACPLLPPRSEGRTVHVPWLLPAGQASAIQHFSMGPEKLVAQEEEGEARALWQPPCIQGGRWTPARPAEEDNAGGAFVLSLMSKDAEAPTGLHRITQQFPGCCQEQTLTVLLLSSGCSLPQPCTFPVVSAGDAGQCSRSPSHSDQQPMSPGSYSEATAHV